MKGVFGKPYVCLDQHINIDQLVNMVEDINYGIAKSHAYIKPNFAATYQTAEDSSYIKEAVKDFGSAYRCWLNDPDPVRQTRGKELLDTDQIAFEYWLQYEYNVVEVMSYLVLRDYVKPYSESYEPLDALKQNNFEFVWTPCSSYFPNFKEWCEQLPLTQLGPVVLLLKTAGDSFPLHNDVFFSNDNYEHQEQFIWLDPRKSRSLYILDNETNTEYKMNNGISYFWNNHDLHGGSNKIDRMSWTIRIEGLFNDELMQKLST